ncbi:MAG: DNA cytosine methyltransferase [Actinomycetota bacterium]|nr:DNA cytosine methyltransferase [Actinomycetota bacterium]
MERSLSLFAGLGGTALGQLRSGNTLAGMVEFDSTFAETLRLNLDPALVLEADVRQVDYSRFGRVDVILGGPPCQPFSQGANNAGEYDERDMIPEFIRAVADLWPRMFLMEEVPTLTWTKHRPYLDRVLADLRRLGYNVDYRVLNMARYGVPQARKRLFVVGRLDGPVQWPAEHEVEVTMAQALSWTEEDCNRRNLLAPEPARGGPFLWPMRRPSTTVVGSFRPDVQAAPGYRKAGDGPRQNTPGSVVITVAEALVLQGLPADWKIAGSEAKQRLQVGNSCPPTMTSQITLANRKAPS